MSGGSDLSHVDVQYSSTTSQVISHRGSTSSLCELRVISDSRLFVYLITWLPPPTEMTATGRSSPAFSWYTACGIHISTAIWIHREHFETIIHPRFNCILVRLLFREGYLVIPLLCSKYWPNDGFKERIAASPPTPGQVPPLDVYKPWCWHKSAPVLECLFPIKWLARN